MKKQEKKIDKKEDKVGRIAEAISDLQKEESIKPRAFASRVNISYSTLISELHIYLLYKEAGLEVLRDVNDKEKLVITKARDGKEIKNEISDIKADLEKIKKALKIN